MVCYRRRHLGRSDHRCSRLWEDREIDSGSLLGRAASGQGSAQQVGVSHGLELTADGNLRLSGATAGSTVKGFYGRDTTGTYGFRDIVPSDLKGVSAARLLGNPTTVAGAAASEIAVGYGLTITTTPVPAVRLHGVAGPRHSGSSIAAPPSAVSASMTSSRRMSRTSVRDAFSATRPQPRAPLENFHRNRFGRQHSDAERCGRAVPA